MADVLSEEIEDQLVSTCRTAIGDVLRSITYLTPTGYEQLYVREDVDRQDEPDAFVETERKGFTSQRTYGWTTLGNYQYTIRAFDHGYIGRVIVGDSGVYVETEALTVEEFDEIAESIRSVLRNEEE